MISALDRKPEGACILHSPAYDGCGGGWLVMWSVGEAGVAGVCSLLSQCEVGEYNQLFILMSHQIAASKVEYYHFKQQFCLL